MPYNDFYIGPWRRPVMAVPALSAAKYLAELSNWSLSNLAIQKLVYIAHMVHLGRHGTKLIIEPIEAWDYGPVIPEIYHFLKAFGSEPVRNVFRRVPSIDENGTEARALRDVYREFGHLSASRLVAATHRPNGAWRSVYRPGIKGNVIPTKHIQSEYLSLSQ